MTSTLSIQEQLGYAKATKLLIIHADDFGLSQAENAATIGCLERGLVNSASIMVPCPWFPQSAAYAKANPATDIGVHLTLTSEWAYYRWRPLSPPQEVPGLIDEEGFMHSSVAELAQHATPEEVEQELRAQINRAIQFDIIPTHLDAHMYSLLAKPAFLAVYQKLGHDYKLPVLLNRDAVQFTYQYDITPYLLQEAIQVDYLLSAEPDNYEAGMADFYANTLQTLQPGLSEILLHPAYNNDEMQAITIDHPYWGANWRQYDFEFFTSETCRELLDTEHIQLITWREIRDKLIRKE